MRLGRLVVSLSFAACLTLAAGCKERDQDDGLANAGALPQPTGSSGDATSYTLIGTLGTGGGSRLVLDLSRQPAPGSANLWSCWPVPPSTFSLGRAVCAADTTNVVELTAANADILCSTAPGAQTTPAATPVPLTSCASYQVYSYAFDPPFLLQIGN